MVTLIEGTDVYHDIQLLSGCCGKCGTIYYADDEHIPTSEGIEAMKFFLNSANYLKVGQKLWVNREFSSASGWTNFFNDTYSNEGFKVSCHHIWAALINEFI